MSDKDFRINITGDASGIKTAASQATDALNQTTEATDKAFVSKNQLKSAVKGLKEEYPALAHVAKLALNPIAFIVAGIASAFAIWKQRVEGLSQALSGLELPQVSERTVAKVNASVTAWTNLGAAINGVASAYNSARTAGDRYMERLNAETSQKKRLLEAERDLALAMLEKDRASMRGGEYEARKLQIEEVFAARAGAIDDQAKRRELAAKRNREANLGLNAARKLSEAEGITVASAEQDAETEKALKEQADAAKERQKLAREWKGRIAEAQSSTWEAMKALPGFAARYGNSVTGTEAAGIEDQAIQNAQNPIDRYNAWLRRKPSRDALRGKRSKLFSEATTDAEESFRLSASVTDEEAAARTESGVSGRISGMQSARRGANALGNLSAEVQRKAEEERRLTHEISGMVKSGGAVTQEMLEALRAVTRDMNLAREEMRKISQQGALRR